LDDNEKVIHILLGWHPLPCNSLLEEIEMMVVFLETIN